MATVGYFASTGELVAIPWTCDYPGRLTVAEARNVLRTHHTHGNGCRIGRTARRVNAAAIAGRAIPVPTP